MTNQELLSQAEALGVSTSYLDWRRRRVRVPEETLRAIVHALDGSDHRAGPPARTATTAMTAPTATTGTTPTTATIVDRLPRVPSSRLWGLTVQLYSVRSRRSWGHGDLHDLADLARWSGRNLGAAFILINPLHAAEPQSPISDSPYLPMTRRYISPLYLRVEDIPEYQQLSSVQRQAVDELAAPLRESNLTPDLIDRDAVWSAKRRALELIYAVARSAQRETDYQQFVKREGTALAGWTGWCALAELHGSDWRTWPPGLGDPRRAAGVLAKPGPVAERVAFHGWLQWLADSQLAEAQRAALAAGMQVGVVGDLAVGVHPGGADAWANQDLLVRGMSVGAPPDGFNQLGQDWGQPPWHPLRLAESGARPLGSLLAAAYRHAGGLRVDHVMGLMRLWWVPSGMTPDRGAYVRYDHRLTVAALTGEAASAGALAIGEDLGTVDAWIRRYLASQHVLGTSMAWFAREADGSPLRPSRWRKACMATVGSHDLPPVSGFVTGDQVTVRARLGLLKDPEGERRAAELALSLWRDVLVAHALLPASGRASVEEFTIALYGYLALTPARLIGVSLADAVGDRRTQNIPGTSSQYPNWRVPLCDGEGKGVLVEDLDDIELVRSVALAASGAVSPDTALPAGR